MKVSPFLLVLGESSAALCDGCHIVQPFKAEENGVWWQGIWTREKMGFWKAKKFCEEQDMELPAPQPGMYDFFEIDYGVNTWLGISLQEYENDTRYKDDKGRIKTGSQFYDVHGEEALEVDDLWFWWDREEDKIGKRKFTPRTSTTQSVVRNRLLYPAIGLCCESDHVVTNRVFCQLNITL